MNSEKDAARISPYDFWSKRDYLANTHAPDVCVLCRRLREMNGKPAAFAFWQRDNELFDHLMDLYVQACGLQRYEVNIRETYSKTVAVYASNVQQAEETANTLCDSGEIDLSRNCYSGRDINAVLLDGPFDSSGLDTYFEDED